jgi:hypothetical protein
MLIGKEVVELVKLERPDGPYIILESTSKATKTDEKSLYILEFKDNDTIKLVINLLQYILIVLIGQRSLVLGKNL